MLFSSEIKKRGQDNKELQVKHIKSETADSDEVEASWWETWEQDSN